MKRTNDGVVASMLRYASRLRFPQLFLLTAALFLLDLLFPDTLPFVDEIILGLGTILLASWRKKKGLESREEGPAAVGGSQGSGGGHNMPGPNP